MYRLADRCKHILPVHPYSREQLLNTLREAEDTIEGTIQRLEKIDNCADRKCVGYGFYMNMEKKTDVSGRT